MNIKDLHTILSISDEKIVLYSNNNIIGFHSDTSNNTEYTWNDINILKLFLELTPLHLSIDTFKGILNKKYSILSCIKENTHYTEPQLKYSNYLLDNIINNKIRQKAYFGYQKVNESYLTKNSLDQQLIFNDDKIYLTNIGGDINKQIAIDYNNIHSIRFMLVNRAPCRRNFKNKKFGIPFLVYGNHGINAYYIDLDIIENNGIIHQFESTNQDNFIEIFNLLKYKQINIQDPLHLYDVFINNPVPVQRMKYFEKNYKIWAVKYHLENPRIDTLEDTLLLQKKVMD